MSETRQITRHVVIARKSDVDGRRIIWGEVMVPIDLEPGGTYRQSEVDRGLHFDGLFMPSTGVMDLAHRGISTRIDIQHDNKPIHADIVESFIARDGAAGWTPGAWVAGVQIHDGASYVPGRDTPARDVWSDIDRGTLTGFSIDFRVLVREFGVTITDDHGENPRETAVGEATDPVPIFLSIVPNPAVGRHFQVIARSAVPFQDLTLAAPEADWNAAAALDRIRQFAGGVDLDPAIYQRAFLWRNDDEPLLLGSYHLPIADVVGDELQAIPRAVFAAAAQLDEDTRIPEDDKAAIRDGLARYYERSGRPSPWPGVGVPVIREDAPAACGLRRGARLASTLNSAIDAMVTDDRSRGDVIAAMGSAAGISSSTVGNIISGTNINCPPLGRLEGFAEVLSVSMATLVSAAESDGCTYGDDERAIVSFDDAGEIVTKSTDNGGDMPSPNVQNTNTETDADAIEKARKRGFLSAMASLFGITRSDAVEEIVNDVGGVEVAAQPADDTITQPPADDKNVEREHTGPTTFGDAMQGQAVGEDLIDGFFIVMDVLNSILSDESVEDKPTAMKTAVADFARWMEGRIDSFNVDRTVTAERAAEIARHIQIDRAKMATKRLERFTSAVEAHNQVGETLRAILTEVSASAAPRTEDAERSTGDEAPADTAPDLTELIEVTRKLADERGEQLRLTEAKAEQLQVDLNAAHTELALAKTARPMPRSGAHDTGEATAGNVQPTPKTPHEVLANSGLWNRGA